MGLKTSIFGVIAAAVVASGAMAARADGPITIPNGSFETPNVGAVGAPFFYENNFFSFPFDYSLPFTGTDAKWVHAPQPGTWYSDAGPIPGLTNSWAATAGVFNNTSSVNVYGLPNVNGVVGEQGAFFFQAPFNQISQQVGDVYKAGKVYKLTFSAQGGGLGMPLGTKMDVGLYYVEAGNKVFVNTWQIENTFDNPGGPDGFGFISQLVDYTFWTDALPAEAIGKEIGIAFTSTSNSLVAAPPDGSPTQAYITGYGYWDIDNVQLAEVPEPASLGILAAGAAGLCMRRSRRRV